jgi:hypothetical protein
MRASTVACTKYHEYASLASLSKFVFSSIIVVAAKKSSCECLTALGMLACAADCSRCCETEHVKKITRKAEAGSGNEPSPVARCFFLTISRAAMSALRRISAALQNGSPPAPLIATIWSPGRPRCTPAIEGYGVSQLDAEAA